MSVLTATDPHTTALNASAHLTTLVAKVCPKAPPGAQGPVDQIQGYILWGVGVLFGIAVFVAIGAVVAGRVFAMPHASKAGVVSVVVVFACVVGYLVLPGMASGTLGNGCV